MLSAGPQGRKPLIYIASPYSVTTAPSTASSSYEKADGDGSCGVKRKHEDDEVTSVDELRESLLNTCISKLSATTAVGSRRKRTLRHAVLIGNMLQSLERVSKPQNTGHSSLRARVTARRRSSDSIPSVTTSRDSSLVPSELAAAPMESVTSVGETKQHQQSTKLWNRQQQPLERLSLPLDMDSSEVMSSPTATFPSVVGMNILPETVLTELSPLNGSDLLSEVEVLDVGCDYSSQNTDLFFFEQVSDCKMSAVASSLAKSVVCGSCCVCCDKTTTAVTCGEHGRL